MSFWTVFKADLLFGICYALFTCLLYAIYALIKKRNFSRAKTKVMGVGAIAPARALIIGGQKEATPGHCPLCGQLWHLPGPEKQ